ncbi:MAG: O-methyltransferase [Actinocatenispora sp.]
MTNERWSAVDDYLTDVLLPKDPVLDQVLAASDAAGLPPISITAPQGRLLNLLARIHGARTILEVGTLGGYSTIWMARALPAGGRLITLEADPHHAEVARANIAHAGLSDVVEVRLGPAAETMTSLSSDGPFDLIFIDADKTGYPGYLRASLALSRPGTVIIADNVVRNGKVSDPDSKDESVQAVRRYLELVAADPRLEATAIQTVGQKGYDGFALAVVTGEA